LKKSLLLLLEPPLQLSESFYALMENLRGRDHFRFLVHGLITLHPSGAYVSFTQAGADLFA
jgi:hypothetical protein